MTNGDKLRSMSDEELAQELTVLLLNAMYNPKFNKGAVNRDSVYEILRKEIKEVSENETN